MTSNDTIDKTIAFVKQTLTNAEGGHDWFHIERVYRNALLIAKTEPVDTFVVALAALLHDIADSKFHDGDETIGPHLARTFMVEINVDSKIIEHIVKIIENISFKSSLASEDNTSIPEKFSSPELDVVQDADRLDAIGAIGIARCFNYGGFKNRAIYDPAIQPDSHMSKETYKASKAPSINHFYEKLLLLKDHMNTKTGRKLAEKRHQFMENYLSQFYKEWQGEA